MNRISHILSACAVVSAIACASAIAGTSERVVADRFSGLAISGFDPVAYFTDASAREGRDEFELSETGAVWRFRNLGNRASFAADPEVYAPQFGGYDPVDVARGVARGGRPQFWLIVDQRLYLFGDEESRAAFSAGVATARRAALDAWPSVEAGLAR